MCGPLTIPVTFAAMPKCPSASSSCAATFSCKRDVGLAGVGVRALQEAASGTCQTKSSASVTDPRSRALRGEVELGRLVGLPRPA